MGKREGEEKGERGALSSGTGSPLLGKFLACLRFDPFPPPTTESCREGRGEVNESGCSGGEETSGGAARRLARPILSDILPCMGSHGLGNPSWACLLASRQKAVKCHLKSVYGVCCVLETVPKTGRLRERMRDTEHPRGCSQNRRVTGQCLTGAREKGSSALRTVERR